MKTYQVLRFLGLNDIGIDLLNRPLEFDIGIVNLHPTEGTLWVLHINETYFDSYGCAPPKKLSKFVIKRNGHCLYSEYEIQCLTSKRDRYCATYCLYILI